MPEKPADFPVLFERFLEEGKYLKNLSPKTILSYSQAWATYRKWLGAASNEAELKAACKTAVMALVKENRLDTTTINIYTRSVNSYLSWLQREGITVERQKLSKVKELDSVVPTFTDLQVERMVSYKPTLAAQQRVHVIACVILDIGARIGEVLGLHRPDVDFDSLVMKLTGKGNRQRVVPFTIHLRKILWRYMEDCKPLYGDLVFWQALGQPLNERNVLDDFHQMCAHLNIKAAKNSFHPLRHTMATNYIRQGGDPARLQRILGHSSITTTMKYVHLQTEDLKKVHHQYSTLARSAR
jgi:site-specific recombinase XerD